MLKHKIKDKRLALGLSRKDFAKMFSVHEQTVINWENGKNEPPYKVIEFVDGVDESFTGFLSIKLTRSALEQLVGKNEIVSQKDNLLLKISVEEDEKK